MKKALFMVRVRKNGPPCVGETGKRCYFTNKTDAKAYRNQLREKGQPDVVVSYGPDHHKYIGE